jgi:YjbE family integral membrane protein
VTAEFWTRLLSIIIIDLTLAGDNALVIAMAVRSLPPERRFWARILGTGAAVALRLVFIAAATYLLRIPLLQAVGGVLLVWIAYKLVRQEPGGDEGGDGHQVKSATSLYQAIWVILVADAVMSLDNVIAVAGAAAGEMVLVALGIGFSIPLVIWGSTLLSALMDRYPWVIWLGGGILGYVAVEMFLHDAMVAPVITHRLSPVAKVALPWLLGAVIVVIAWWTYRARAKTAARET